MLTAELLFHNGDSVYTLEVTPSDHRASNTARTLTIFIISKNFLNPFTSSVLEHTSNLINCFFVFFLLSACSFDTCCVYVYMYVCIYMYELQLDHSYIYMCACLHIRILIRN